MIAMGSAAALRNLMANRPARFAKDAAVAAMGASSSGVLTPSLPARKHKALLDELDAQQLSETFDNIDNLSPKAANRKARSGGGGGTYESGSREKAKYANVAVLEGKKVKQKGIGGEREEGKWGGGVGGVLGSDEVTYARNFPPKAAAVAPPPPKFENRASSDSLNSVTSADGYKSKSESCYSSEECDAIGVGGASSGSKFCAYRKYPADLAHKIRSANHMEDDDDADLDTPINYSLKYSDEQLNSGRQSPNRTQEVGEEEVGRRGAGFRGYTGRKETGSGGEAGGMRRQRFVVVPPAGYDIIGSGEDDKPTNYGERYAEGERPEEQPIDYSLKYDVTSVGNSAPCSVSSSSSVFKSPTKDAAGSAPSSAASSSSSTSLSSVSAPSTNQNTQLRPQNATAVSSANPRILPGKINQETLQTYCVEDTPICFSRGSSLSSLSSQDDDDDVIDRKGRSQEKGGNDYPTLPISEKETLEKRRREKETVQAVSAIPKPKRSHAPSQQMTSSSGAHTPKSPPLLEDETPLMFSRCTSLSSLDSFEAPSSLASSLPSLPCGSSGVPSGVVSPSELPDSPGQTAPPSRAKTPPPEATKAKEMAKEAERKSKRRGVNGGEENESSGDVLLHFATESTPAGFSRASSLSALSLDEPYIPKEDEKLAKMTKKIKKSGEENIETESQKEKKAANQTQREAEPAELLDESDDDDDISILEACINSAMPKSSRKPKSKTTAPQISAAVSVSSSSSAPSLPSSSTAINRSSSSKPSQLPVYKLLPTSAAMQQSRGQSQPRKTMMKTATPPNEEVPRVYCVEGTPLNFSAATSLSDLTIDSPPAEPLLLASPLPVLPLQSTSPNQNQRKRQENLPEGDENEESEAILAECISAAMPKGRRQAPPPPAAHPPQAALPPQAPPLLSAPTPQAPPLPAGPKLPVSSSSSSTSNSSQQQKLLLLQSQQGGGAKKKPTSPVKPMPQKAYTSSIAMVTKAANQKPGFAFDSPRHYTPIEGTPYCFSRNDSLSSLDFDDDDAEQQEVIEEEGEGHRRRRRRSQEEKRAKTEGKREEKRQTNTEILAKFEAGSEEKAQKGAEPRPPPPPQPVSDERQRFAAVEDTPVCFSRNSSLSSLSDIDQENNNNEFPPKHQEVEDKSLPVSTAPVAMGGSEGQKPRPPVASSGYAPKAFHVEDTPVCFSRNSSLSSLSIDSEDDLLQECISSAMPKKKKQGGKTSATTSCIPASLPMQTASLPVTKNEERQEENSSILAEKEPQIEEHEEHEREEIGESQVDEAGCSPASPDSESFDWKAIQEGANSIVSSLNQAAAAAACFSRQASSDSDSVLSLKSAGSPFHLSANRRTEPEDEEEVDEEEEEVEEEEVAKKKGGPRILKPEDAKKKEEQEVKSVKGGKKVYRSLITGKPREAMISSASRGRAKLAGSASRAGRANEDAGGRGRGGAAASSSSRDSTPNSRQSSNSGNLIRSKLSQLPRTASPGGAGASASGITVGGACGSGGGAARAAFGSKSRQSSGIPRSESASRSLATNRKQQERDSKSKGSAANQVGPSSEGAERQDKPQLVRQSTFIKEAPSPTLKRKLEESASFESLSSPMTSPTSVTAATVSAGSTGLAAVNWRAKSPQSQLGAGVSSAAARKQEMGRSHSESPSRPTDAASANQAVVMSSSTSSRFSRTGTWKRENANGSGAGSGNASKHSSSLPRVGTWKRSGSSSSVLSASSESSEKGRSLDGEPERRRKTGSANGKRGGGTWRKGSGGEEQEVAAIGSDKSEEIWVKMEDCPVNSSRCSSASSLPTATNSPPVIDGTIATGKTPSSSSCSSISSSCAEIRSRLPPESNLNLRKSCESLDRKLSSSSLSSPGASGDLAGKVSDFPPQRNQQQQQQRCHQRVAAARVSPFNYTPSPRKSANSEGGTGVSTATTATSSTATRPSMIPTPVAVTPGAKRRETKGEKEERSGGGGGSGERGSYIVTSV